MSSQGTSVAHSAASHPCVPFSQRHREYNHWTGGKTSRQLQSADTSITRDRADTPMEIGGVGEEVGTMELLAG
eukprot:6351656-Amphidinium_carterae.1